MKKFKAASLVLAFAMTMSLAAGCNSSNGSKQTDSNKPVTASDTPKNQSPTKIVMGGTSTLQSDPVLWHDTELMKEIEQKANVEIEYIEYDQDKFNLLLASRDLPDFVHSIYGDKIADIIAGDLALDMWPLLEKNAPNMILPEYTKRNEMVRNLKSGKNKEMFFLPDSMGLECARGSKINYRGYNIRWDYYLEEGAPEITDDDTYLKIMQDIIKKHTKTPDGKKMYASGVHDSLDAWFDRGAFTKPSLLNIWTFMNSQYMSGNDDNVLYNGYTDTSRSAFWLDMGFYNKMYKMGMLDPDSFTQTGDDKLAKVTAGQYIACMGWSEELLYNNMKKEDPNTLAGIMQIPSKNALAFTDYYVAAGTFPSYYMFISKTSKNADAVLRLFNVLHDSDVQRMLYSGKEGIHWDYVDGVPTMKQEYVDMFTNSNPKLKEIGFRSSVPVNAIGIRTGSLLHTDGFPLDLMDTDDMRVKTLTPIQKSVADHYKVLYPGQSTYKLATEGKAVGMDNALGEQIALGLEPMPSDISRVVEKCNDILYRAIPHLVMAKSQDEFNTTQQKVFKDLQSAGEDKVWIWCQENYNRAKDIIEPILSNK